MNILAVVASLFFLNYRYVSAIEFENIKTHNTSIKTNSPNSVFTTKNPSNLKRFIRSVSSCRNNPPLHLAVAFVRKLLENGANMDALNCENLTPKDIAGNREIFKTLFAIPWKKKEHDHSKTLNIVATHCKNTPLHHAVAAILTLLEEGADPEEVDCRGATPVIISSITYNVEIVLTQSDEPEPECESEGTTVDMKRTTPSYCGRTALHSAVMRRNLFGLKTALAEGADMYAVDCDGLTPMDIAVLGDDGQSIEAMVRVGYFDLNRKRIKGNTVLHLAVTKSSRKTVELLLDLGSYIDAMDNEGSTPFFEALIAARRTIAELLVQRGAQVKLKLYNGDTYVHKLSEKGYVDGLIILKNLHLLNPTFINVLNNFEESSLLKAVKANHPAIVHLLLTLGADAFLKTEDGQTLNHYAVQSKCTVCLQLLLDHGVPSDQPDYSGITPSLIAVREDDKESLELLAAYGADLTREFNFGDGEITLIQEAAIHGSIGVIRWLLHTRWVKQKVTPLEKIPLLPKEKNIPTITTTTTTTTTTTAPSIHRLRYFTLASGRKIYVR